MSGTAIIRIGVDFQLKLCYPSLEVRDGLDLLGDLVLVVRFLLRVFEKFSLEIDNLLIPIYLYLFLGNISG